MRIKLDIYVYVNIGVGVLISVSACPWFSPGTLVSSTNKTDHHDITEILLKVAFSTITLKIYINNSECNNRNYFFFPALKLYVRCDVFWLLIDYMETLWLCRYDFCANNRFSHKLRATNRFSYTLNMYPWSLGLSLRFSHSYYSSFRENAIKFYKLLWIYYYYALPVPNVPWPT